MQIDVKFYMLYEKGDNRTLGIFKVSKVIVEMPLKGCRIMENWKQS